MLSILNDHRSKLIVNYIFSNEYISSFEEILTAFDRAKRKIIALYSNAKTLHNYVIPSRNKRILILPKKLKEQVAKYEDLFFLRDIKPLVIEKIDVAKDVMRDPDLAKKAREVFELVYNKPLIRADSLNEDGLNFLEALNIIGIIRRKDRELGVFPLYNRCLDKEIIKNLRLLTPPLKSQPIGAIGIRLSIPRPTIPNIKIHQTSLKTNFNVKNIITTKVIRTNFLPMIRTFLESYKITNFRKLEKDLARMFIEEGYSFNWLEYGSFAHLYSRSHIPENIIIQAAKRKYPTRKTLPYLKAKYNIRGTTAAVFVCPQHIPEMIHRRFFPDWHVVFYDPSKKTWWYRAKFK